MKRFLFSVADSLLLSSVKFIFERKRIAKVMTEEETLDGWIPVACSHGEGLLFH